MATELSPPIDPLDRLPLEIWNECIFPLVPHLSRLRCRCVSSKWYRVLKAQELAARAKPAPVWCLAIVVDVEDIIPGDTLAGREEGPLRCIAISPCGGVLPLPQLTFPPDWRPDMNGGGFRAGGGLVAYFCEGYYRVGNPLHNMWEKVKSETTTLRFKRNSFALVVDECAGSYEIVAYGMNDPKMDNDNPLTRTREGRPRDDTDRDHDNWFIQVYSSKSRTWRAGVTLDQQVFSGLDDVCVFERAVYFLGRLVSPPGPRLSLPDGWSSIRGPSDDPVIHEQVVRYFKAANRPAVWAYDLDSNILREVVPPAQYHGGPGSYDFNFARGTEDYDRSLRLLVSREPGRKPSSLQFNLFVVRRVRNDDGRGPWREKLVRLRLDEKDPSIRFWDSDAEHVAGIDELVAGGPKAALVADTWGVGVVAYTGFDLFRPYDIDENPYPWGTLRILCYHRDEQKWIDWYGYEPSTMKGMSGAAVGFVACECCRGELISAGPFDELRNLTCGGS